MKNKTKGLIHTIMMHKYIMKFILRILIFVLVLLLYIFRKEWIWDFMNRPITHSISPLQVLWFVFMCIMISHLFPGKIRSMALLKSKEEEYIPVPGYSEFELLKYVQDQNRKAWKMMLVWMSGNAVVGLLYLANVLHEEELLLLTVFYFLSDYICILVFCPFQSFIMKNKCCVNCRCYDWGHFMMFTPMLFIQNFFSWSLFFTSVVVLIHWEILYSAHPERFWEGSNKRLQCANCTDKTCQMKKGLEALLKPQNKGKGLPHN